MAELNMQDIFLFAGAIAIALVLINVYFKVADRFNIIDKPNERSSHSTITIRGAGTIFPIMAVVALIVSKGELPYLTAGLFLIGAIGFIDDILDLSARIRVLVQLGALSLMFMETAMFSGTLSVVLIVALYIFVMGLINAYNFMDGINGITGLYTLSILLPFYLLFDGEQVLSQGLFYGVVAASIAFLFYNLRKKARCFLGDVGSVSIALLVSYIIVSISLQEGHWYYFALMSLYGVDSILTIAHRLLRKQNIFKAHRFHLYQLLANEEKWPHARVSILYAVLQTLLNIVLLKLAEEYRWNFAILSILVLSIVYLVTKSKLIKKHGI